MYDEEIESLIDAALVDGEITEKERQILLKKAMEFDIDPDEFEMVLDARILKLKKQAEEQNQTHEQAAPAPVAPKNNKRGVVKKCPSCGATVQSFHGVCPECGYAFEDVEANSSVRKLADDLEKKGKSREDGEEWDDYYKMSSIITRFPVPNSNADLIDLITFIQTQMSSISVSGYRKACSAKLKECSIKAKLLYPHDTLLMPLIQEIEKIEKNNKIETVKLGVKKTIFVILGIFLIIVGIFCGYKIWCLDWAAIWRIVLIFYVEAMFIAFGLLLIEKEV